MGYYRHRSTQAITEKHNSTGSNWTTWYGHDLSWKGSERTGHLEGNALAGTHHSYHTIIGAMLHLDDLKVRIHTTQSYSITTSQHRDAFGHEGIYIGASERELRDLAVIFDDIYIHGIKRDLPEWVTERVEHEQKRLELQKGSFEKYRWKIEWTEYGKIKKLCARVTVQGPRMESYWANYRMRKNETVEKPYDLPRIVECKIIEAIEKYHEFTTNREVA